MDPKHINPLKLQLLADRMRSGKLPSKTPSTVDAKQSNNSDREIDEKVVSEIQKAFQNNLNNASIQDGQVNANPEELTESDKENKISSLDVEPSEKIGTTHTKEMYGEEKMETIVHNHSIEVSYDNSADLSGRRSLKKRKFDKLEKTPEKLDLKKTKLTLKTPPVIEGGMFLDKISRMDSSGGSMDNEQNMFNKEALVAPVGTKKITEFFKKKEGVTMTEKILIKPNINNFTKIKSKTLVEKKASMEIIQETPAEDKKELYSKIKELEDKVDYMRKEREKDKIRSENEIKSNQDKFNKYKANVHKISAKHVLEIETYKRNERKSFLSRQRQRLGEYVSQREGSKFVDVWSDGFEMRSVKEKLDMTIKEKEELEKQKKNLKSKKLVLGPVKNGMHSESHANDIFNSDSNSNSDMREGKERINAKLTMLQREETMLREQLEKLEAEKVIFYQQYKKQYEEDHSRYGRPNAETNAPAWPILNERYQLLSLLGKGGFSEVYSAYDLEELCYVASKVHQLNPNWTENAKSNYVKHANREFEVHKELSHPNIVRLFDCINIDDHSFATILEYCEGPDLSTYLKQHKILPEKDAKVIIKQILAGLRYLNDHKTKIIHYDLKPQNVMFHKGEIKISDFGLCKIVDSGESRIELTSQGVGTYWYLPPECFLMDDQPPMINNKVDVWSVGVMYYEMLFGMKPFGHNMSQEKILKEQIILKSYSVNFPTKPAVTTESKDFIRKCLAYNQDDRIDVCQAYDMMYKK